jgi:hypothetical protein
MFSIREVGTSMPRLSASVLPFLHAILFEYFECSRLELYRSRVCKDYSLEKLRMENIIHGSKSRELFFDPTTCDVFLGTYKHRDWLRDMWYL